MNGTEFKNLLKQMRVSQRQFASETGMSTSAINEWATDRAKMPPIAAAYIRLRLDAFDLIDRRRSNFA